MLLSRFTRFNLVTIHGSEVLEPKLAITYAFQSFVILSPQAGRNYNAYKLRLTRQQLRLFMDESAFDPIVLVLITTTILWFYGFTKIYAGIKRQGNEKY